MFLSLCPSIKLCVKKRIPHAHKRAGGCQQLLCVTSQSLIWRCLYDQIYTFVSGRCAGESGEESGDTWLPCLQVKVGSGRKSIFAQKMAARRAAEKEATAPSAECMQTRAAALDALDPEGSAGDAPLPSIRDGKWRRFCLSSLPYLHSLSNHTISAPYF